MRNLSIVWSVSASSRGTQQPNNRPLQSTRQGQHHVNSIDGEKKSRSIRPSRNPLIPIRRQGQTPKTFDRVARETPEKQK